MTILDFIFIIPLAFFLIKGYQRGIIIELISILALVIAIIGCLKLTFMFVEAVGGSVAKTTWFPLISYLIVFIIIYMLVYYVGKFLEKVLKTSQLNFINRIAGALLGIFKAVLLFSLLIWLLNMVQIFPESIKEKSVSYQYIKPVAPVLINFLSSLMPFFKDIIQQIEGFFDEVAKYH